METTIDNKHMRKATNPVWRFFISVKLTVVLLILLAVTSAAGTIIPQTGNPEQYIQMYGSLGYNLIHVLDLSDMYHSWWFRTLIGLLTINIIVCTLNRWPITWNLISSARFNPEKLVKGKPKNNFKDQRIPTELKSLYKSYMEKKFNLKGVHTLRDGFRIYGEKGRWSRLGVPVVHLSVVLILAGALMGSFGGFDGYVNIPEGGSADMIRLRNSKGIVKLGFEIVCNDFNIDYYDSGSVKEYRSALQIKQNGKVLVEKNIIVNDPLKFNGIRFFQSSYGALPPENLEIKIRDRESDLSVNHKIKLGETVQLPDNSGEFTVTRFNKDYRFKNVELGQAVEGELKLQGQDPVPIALPFKYPTFDKMRKGQWVISLENHDNKFYTGLQVRKDPGIYLVYLGFLLILGGCWIIFFNSHQKILLEVKSAGENSAISIYGFTNKHKMDFQRKIKKITKELKLL